MGVSDGNVPEAERGVAAVDRALTILSAFRPDEPSVSLHELAARTGLYKSTLLRLIGTLERHGCVQRTADRGYQLGPMFVHWARVFQSSLRLDDHVLPVMRQLVEDTGEGASFSIRQGDQSLCLFRVDTPRQLRDIIRPGDMFPLRAGSTGELLLAHAPETDPATRPAYLFTKGARDPDLAAVSAPVYGTQNALVGAMTVSGLATRFTEEKLALFLPLLLAAAAELSRRLGGGARG